MKIIFWSVGKAHDSYVKEGIQIFTRRISHYFPVEWKLFPTAKNAENLSPEEIKKAEGISILNVLQNNDVLVALDENGKQWDSVELANFIQQKANESSRNLIFFNWRCLWP